MPTIILLDVSLSMCKVVNNDGDPIEVKQHANVGVGTLLDYFAQNTQLEYTSLIVFSSLWEIRHQFTRHHESIKNGIYDLELYDKSNIVNAVRGVLSLKLHEWVQNGPVNIILITDGQTYHQNMNKAHIENTTKSSGKSDDFMDIPLMDLEGQFDFPCKIQLVCLTSPQEPALKHTLPFYKRLVSIVDTSITECPVIIGDNLKNYRQSAIWIPGSESMDLNIKSTEALFSRIAEAHYKPYRSILSCGHLSSMIMLSPSPTDCLLEPLKNEFDDLKSEQLLKKETTQTFVSAINKKRLYKLSEEINVCGFLPLQEIASPAVTSRHLVLPIINDKFNETSKAEQILSQDPNAYNKSIQQIDETLQSAGQKSRANKFKIQVNDNPSRSNKTSATNATESHPTMPGQDITKQPSFCVLLHNALKQENMVAICIIGKNEETNNDWFGMLHSHTDSKKRSSLMLSLFIPGPNPILWLPNFRTMGSSSLNADIPAAIRDKVIAARTTPKSYSSNSVIWLDPESVQADVQKIIRHAKRSPDKAPHFYKELNRIRRAAISYGFYDVLSGLAAILEREKRVMTLDQSKNVNEETLKHIDHVVTCLRGDLNEGSYDTIIMPDFQVR